MACLARAAEEESIWGLSNAAVKHKRAHSSPKVLNMTPQFFVAKSCRGSTTHESTIML
jgi:hypothetical protein